MSNTPHRHDVLERLFRHRRGKGESGRGRVGRAFSEAIRPRHLVNRILAENSPKLPVSDFCNLTLQASREKFPHGMKWLAEQIRALDSDPASGRFHLEQETRTSITVTSNGFSTDAMAGH